MNELSKKIADKRLLKLIHSILRADIEDDGKLVGCKQGDPLSPLLSNIILDKLDKELKGVDTVSCGMLMIVVST